MDASKFEVVHIVAILSRRSNDVSSNGFIVLRVIFIRDESPNSNDVIKQDRKAE